MGINKLMAGDYNIPQNLLHKLNRQIQQKTIHIQTDERDEKKKNSWATFNYYRPQIRKFNNLFKYTNIGIAFRNTNTLQQIANTQTTISKKQITTTAGFVK
jgi:hypothetical protein